MNIFANMSKTAKLVAAVALQVLVVLVIVIFKVSVLHSGTEVILSLAPVDPTDFFRGDYMTIRYELSNIDSYYFKYSPVRNGDVVYVPLQDNNRGVWSMAYDRDFNTGVVNKLPEDKKGYVYIKGTVVSGADGSTGFSNNTWGNWNRGVQIAYNIEDYFIPQGTGHSWPGTRDAYAKVLIDRSGNAVLKQLYVGGKSWPDGKTTFTPALRH